MLLLLRHGETDMNLSDQELVRGTSDIPLNETGVRQANVVADRIARDHPETAYVVCDKLQRTRQTAEVIAQRLKTWVLVHPELGPWDTGLLQFQLAEEAEPSLVSMSRNYDEPLPGGITYGEYYRHLESVMSKLVQQAKGKTVAVVWHSSNFKALPGITAGSTTPVRIGGAEPPFGDYIEVDW